MAAGINAPANDAAILFKINSSVWDVAFELINLSNSG